VAEISNDKIYELLNAMRLELKGDIGDLRRQFETLEAGRLTRLEGKVQDMQVADIRQQATLREGQAVISTKVLILFTIGYIILTGILTAVFTRVLR
jgi:hypothetical protein